MPTLVSFLHPLNSGSESKALHTGSEKESSAMSLEALVQLLYTKQQVESMTKHCIDYCLQFIMYCEMAFVHLHANKRLLTYLVQMRLAT